MSNFYIKKLNGAQTKLVREYCDYHGIKYFIYDKNHDEFHFEFYSLNEADDALEVIKARV
jgi:hypothetical protein